MELYVYDRNLVQLGLIEKITSFIWTRRYWYVGGFQLLVPFTVRHAELLKKRHLITMRSDMEAGEIRFVEIRKNEHGKEEIEVTGQFISGWIGKRTVLNPIIMTAPPQQIINRLVTENVTNPTAADRRIEDITHAPIADIQRPNVEYASEPFINVKLATKQIAKAAQLGFNIAADIRQRRLFFNIYDGRDLTEDQQANPPAVFSMEFDNVLEQTFTNCIENLRTVAYVGGEATGNRPRRIVEVGNATGLDRDEVFINASDILSQQIGDAQMNAQLTQRGIQQLGYFAETLGFASKINQHANLRYKTDYDLGDRVTCINQRWGVRINARITEITETYQDHSKAQIDITFGESLPALTDQLRTLVMQK